jgi:hypothetical protein
MTGCLIIDSLGILQLLAYIVYRKCKFIGFLEAALR